MQKDSVFKRVGRALFRWSVSFFSRGLGLSQRFPAISKIYGFFISKIKNAESPITVNGFTMFLDPKDSLRLSVFGIYEEFETELVKKEIKKGWTVVDAGANIGYYTLLFSSLVGDEGRVYAFEPDPINFEILKKNIEVNHCNNVILEQKALSNQSGKITLYVSDENKGDHRIFNSGDARTTVEVEAVKLDDYLNMPVDFLKMDVQGAEVLVLEGATRILGQSPALKIFSEFWPAAIRTSGKEPREFFSILERFNFSFSNIHYTKRAIVPVERIDEFVSKDAVHADGGVNIFAKKK